MIKRKVSNPNLINTISLVVGDWSKDGHSESDTFIIKSNLTVKEIEKAYKIGSKKAGFDLVKDVCKKYQDGEMPIQNVQSLEKAGYKFLFIDATDRTATSIQLLYHTDEWAEIYTFIVKLGNPIFDYEYIDDDSAQINIGGYGLFGD